MISGSSFKLASVCILFNKYFECLSSLCVNTKNTIMKKTLKSLASWRVRLSLEVTGEQINNDNPLETPSKRKAKVSSWCRECPNYQGTGKECLISGCHLHKVLNRTGSPMAVWTTCVALQSSKNSPNSLRPEQTDMWLS